MNKVTLCENTLDPDTWTTTEDVVDVPKFLVEHFGIWPEGARIYLDHVSNRTDITPYDTAGIERLAKAQGHFYVVVYPQGIELIFIIVAVAIAATALALVFIFRPSAKKNQNEQSANNDLADRKNEARPLERIPDIFGQVWATFDLLAYPYRTFVSNIEIEHNFMCIGRGEYDLLADNIRDDITPLYQTDGAQVGVYGPGQNPNNGGTPFVTVGAAISEPVVNLQPFGSVNGQVLRAPNKGTWQGGFPGPGNIRFVYPNKIQNNIGFDFNFSAFRPGDEITIGGFTDDGNDDLAVDPLGAYGPVHLGGQYFIQTTPNPFSPTNEIQLVNPVAINPNWATLAHYDGGAGDSTYRTIYMADNGIFSAGPFTIINLAMTEFWCNFVAAQGSYYLDKNGNQFEVDSVIQVNVQQCNSSGAAIGAIQKYFVTIYGSQVDRQMKGSTLKIVIGTKLPGFAGIIVSAKRISQTDMTQGHSVVDEVQWRDAYIVSPLPTNIDFGNVTTVQSIVRPTPSALAIKERKQNALVTRKVPAWSGSAFGANTASQNAADILCAMALDPYIGNRQLSEIDPTEIYSVLGITGLVATYFGSVNFCQFCYTFDDSKVSFEESASDLAQACFCTAFRRGAVLQVSFEQPAPNSVLLFNHRNKVPKSETRTVTFGTPTDNDGIDLDYIEPNAPNFPNLDTLTTLYFPLNKSAKNPKKFTAVGVRNVQQAMALGYRLYNKLQFQNTITQFDATEEAALLVIMDRILVADNTRSDTQDGEVIAQNVLELTLSQKVVFLPALTYTIYLQHPDETVEAIGITPGSTDRKVILASAPSVPCVVDPNMYARTTYMIVSSAPVRSAAFLVNEKNPKDNKTYELKCINYDPNYYKDDFTFTPPGVTPSYIFMPTTNGADVNNGDSSTGYGEYGDVYNASEFPLGPDSGTLLRTQSATLVGYLAPGYLVFKYSPASFYAAPGSDSGSVPPRADITKIELVYDAWITAALSGYNPLCGCEYSLDNGSTWNTGPGGPSVGGTIQEFTADLTSAISGLSGGIAAYDFTKFQLRFHVASSISDGPEPLPGSIFQVTLCGLRLYFNGATSVGSITGGSGGGSGTGGTGGGGTNPNLGGYTLTPSNALSQPDSTHIDMAAVLCAYKPAGPNVNFNSRSWTITDPGGTPVTYYVSIYDPTKIGDASGTLTSLIGTSLSAVNDGQPGYVTIGSITAVHISPNVGAGEVEDIGITIDGGGSPPTTGSKGYRPVDYACTIVGWKLAGDQSSGSAQITVKKCADVSFPTTASIVASVPPAIVTAKMAESTTLTGWTTTINAGDWLEFNLDSVTTHQRLVLTLTVQRT